jgi:hypothetical protein
MSRVDPCGDGGMAGRLPDGSHPVEEIGLTMAFGARRLLAWCPVAWKVPPKASFLSRLERGSNVGSARGGLDWIRGISGGHCGHWGSEDLICEIGVLRHQPESSDVACH